MPILIPFTEDQVEEMRQMRWAGASLRDIADYFGTSATTILSYTRSVKPQPNGQTLVYMSVDIIHDWRPVLPQGELPLPLWFSNWMRERLRVTKQSPSGDSYSAESEYDDPRRR
jgi:hypothetical protein